MNIREWFASQDEYKDYDDEDILEVICYDGDTVWKDSYLDEHRWYSLQEVVVKIDNIYIKYNRYLITGDNCMSDMDLRYNLDDFHIVEKKTRIIEEVYYG